MIGILGGTFDPVHEGHFHIATQVLFRLDLEQVQFMPCALPVHRDEPHASATDRCAMIELMIADQAAFALNTLELDRSGPSYMIDSLREIRRQSDASLVLVLGADAFNDFASWKLPMKSCRLLTWLSVIGRVTKWIRIFLMTILQIHQVVLSEQSAGAILSCSKSKRLTAPQARCVPRWSRVTPRGNVYAQ